MKRALLLLLSLTGPIFAGCAPHPPQSAQAIRTTATIPPTTATTPPATTTTAAPCPTGSVTSTIRLGPDLSGDSFGYTASGTVTNNRNDPIQDIDVSFTVTFPDGSRDTSPVAAVQGVIQPGASAGWGPSDQEGAGPVTAVINHVTFVDAFHPLTGCTAGG